MAEYDAFGRKKGENPLEQQPAQIEPVAAPAAPAAPARPRARVFPIVIAAAVVVALASIGVAVSLLAVTSGGDAGESVTVGESAPAPQEDPGSTDPGVAPPPPAAEPRSGSLLDPSSLARAIDEMRGAELGRPVSLRVTAERLDAQLVTPKGMLRTVQVGTDGEPRELNATQAGPVPSMPWSAVDPAAPSRMMRAAAEREKRPAAEVDYLVLLDLGEPTWGLFFKGGTHYQGDAAGKSLRRVN